MRKTVLASLVLGVLALIRPGATEAWRFPDPPPDLIAPGARGPWIFGSTRGEPEAFFKFGKADVGKLPAGWKAAHTGKGEGSVWKVVADDTTPSKSGYALAQTAESP